MAEGNGKTKTSIDLDALRGGLVEFNSPRQWRNIGGQILYIRAISGAERDKLEVERIKDYRVGPDGQPTFSKRDLDFENFRARHAVVFLGDADNNRIFTDDDREHVGHTWPGYLLDEVYEIGRAHNHMERTAGERAEKNSPAAS